MQRKIPTRVVSLVTAIVLHSTALSVAMAQQLVANWKFDEGSGNVAQDSSGKNNSGEIVNARWVDGISGKALAFVDYSAEYPTPDAKKAAYVRVKSSNQLNPTKGFDISAAIYIEASFSPTFAASLLEKGDGYGCSYRLLVMGDLKVRAAAGNEHATLDSATKLTPGKWITLRASYDGQKLRIYIDGKEDASIAAEVKNFSSSDDIFIGKRFTGRIDEVKISVQ